jgi:type IV secretory pathway VirB10-like protein
MRSLFETLVDCRSNTSTTPTHDTHPQCVLSSHHPSAQTALHPQPAQHQSGPPCPEPLPWWHVRRTRKASRQVQTHRQTQTRQTDRRNQNSQTQTKVRQNDIVRRRRTSEDTDETTTEQQRSQFAVVEDESTKHLIVDNLAATTDTNHTMPSDNIDESPMTVTRTWEEVFRRLDQWDVVDKLRALHLKSSDSTSSTGFLPFKSPDIAHLMANTARRV